MELGWLILSASVKLLFAISPTMVRPVDFNLGEGREWKEAKEVASVAGVRGMLASLPIALIFQTLERAQALCSGGVAPFDTTVAVVVIVALTAGALRLPAAWLKGAVTPFVLVVALVGGEALFTFAARDKVAHALCATPSNGGPSNASVPASSAQHR